MTVRKEEMIITPWEVKGIVDYNKLVREFGVSLIDPDLYRRLEEKIGQNIYLQRKIFFAHRDLSWLLDEYEKGNKFYLYTGRGPGGDTHLGHLIPWLFTKDLQKKFKTKLYFQMTDDEKFLFKPELTLDKAHSFAYENALDVIAIGFDPKLTQIFSNIDYAKTLYPEALKIAKHLTFSTVKAVFGFDYEANVGQIFFTAMQSVPAFLESIKKGRNVPCLIPHAVDQDAHFRICRDVAPKLGFYKPASIQCKFLPGLGKGGKMSASEPYTAIFTTDTAKQIEEKIMNAFTGGQVNIVKQRQLGGNPDICTVYQYLYFLFELDNREIENRYKECKSGTLMCGECKAVLVSRVQRFLSEHQKRREVAKRYIDKFFVKD
jgi:tryptophanyl-tRNA synthetase